MPNLVWTIDIEGKESFTIKNFIDGETTKNISIGCDISEDICLEEAFPKHVSLFLDNKNGSILLTAHKKLICEYDGKRNLMTKDEDIAFPLQKEKVCFYIHIKNSQVKNTIQEDTSTIDNFPEWKSQIEEAYGTIQKINEGHFTWIYSNGKHIFKILKPAYTMQNEYVSSFIQTADDWMKSSVEQIPFIEDLIANEESKLYAWVVEQIEGQTLYHFMIKNKKIKQELVVSIIETITDFIRDIHLQKRFYGALNPEDIFIDSKNNVLLFGLYRSQLICSGFHGYLPSINGFTPIPQIHPKYNFDENTDVFLLGLLLYYLLSGEKPFIDLTEKEYIQIIQKGKIPSLKFTTKETQKYQKLITKSLQPTIKKQNIQDFWRKFQKQEFDKNKQNPFRETQSIEYKEDYFGKFLLKKKIGRGHLGKVYQAQNTQDEKNLIIKILDGNAKYTKSIINEARNMMTLEHHNILNIVEVGQSGDTPYIAYEYIEGQNLFEYVDSRLKSSAALSSHDCFCLVRELALALQYCHVKGVVHRNIKPTNIIIDEKGTPYLVDFGISIELYMDKMFDKRFHQDYIYQSPSVLFGSLSPLHDVYSLGAILYKLLTNSWNINGLFLPWGRKSFLSRDAESLCSKALAKNSKTRYQNASILVEDIDKLLDHKLILAEPFNWRINFKRRNRILYYLFVFVFNLGLIIAVIIGINNINTSTQSIDNFNEEKIIAQNKYQKYQDGYFADLAKSKNIVASNYSIENSYFQQQIKNDYLNKIQKKYFYNLKQNVLPIYENSRFNSAEHKMDLLKLLEEMLLFAEKHEQQSLLEKYTKLKNDTSWSNTVTIDLQNVLSDELYLHKYEKNIYGALELFPIDQNGNKILENNLSLKMRQLEIDSKNKFTKAFSFLLEKKYFEAQEQLIQAIKNTPHFIQAYHLLCVVLFSSSIDKEKSTTFLFWQQQAFEKIQDLSQEHQELVRNSFSIKNIGKVSQVYEILKSQNLLCIHSVVDSQKKLQKEDFIYKINGHDIYTINDIKKAVGRNKVVTCEILRNMEWLSVSVRSSLFKSRYFFVVPKQPFISVVKNGFLPVSDIVVNSQKNKISDRTLNLPEGSYLLYIKQKEMSFFYPFTLARSIVDGSFIVPEIIFKWRLQDMDPYVNDFSLVTSKLATTSKEQQNSKGYLISNSEITISEWQKFLQNIYDNQKNKLKKYIPIVNNKALFSVYKDKVILIVGDPNLPISGITHEQVMGYISWKNETMPKKWKDIGLKWRLPTVEEWEYAAKGNDDREYPWGDFGNPQFCNTQFSFLDIASPCESGTFVYDVSPFMVRDMAGNVKEYTSNEDGEIVIKGNSWDDIFVFPIKFSLTNKEYSSCGFRLCAGVDFLWESK